MITTTSIILWILSGFWFCLIKVTDSMEGPQWILDKLSREIQTTLRAVWGATTVLALITTIASAA